MPAPVIPELLAVIGLAPPPGWPEVAVAGVSLILGVLVFPRFHPDSSRRFRAVVTCGVATLVALQFELLISGDIQLVRQPQLVLCGIAGSMAGILLVRFAGTRRSST
jgi:hypothetical protein